MPAAKVHPRSLDLLEITQDYPVADRAPGSGSLWFGLKKVLGLAKTAPRDPSLRAAWFAVYEEPNKGYVVFEGNDIKRILLAETGGDLQDLAQCRDLMRMLNDAHGLLRQLDDQESSAFHQRFLSEIWSILRREPSSRKPQLFIQEVHNADCRLNGMFYHVICHAYAAIDKCWEQRDADVEALMHQHQDRVMRLWKNRASEVDLFAWKELLDEMRHFLEQARSSATTETRPDVTCQGKESEGDVQLRSEAMDEDEDVPSLDQMLERRQ
jgi:hypothetical protein